MNFANVMLIRIIDQMDYHTEKANLDAMLTEFKQLSSVNGESVDFWMDDFGNWASTTRCPWIKSHLNTTATGELLL